MEPVDLGKYTFLIVEDQRMTRIQMVNMMKVMGISAVLTASNGQEAIETMAGPSDIACVIADIEMPVMHGIEMLKRIRVGYEGVARNVPVIMTTGHSERDTLGVAMALDVSAFLLKPVKMEPLRDRILRAISLIDSNEQWLKPSTAYGCIHVSESLEDILAGSEEDAAPTTRVDDALERLAERRVIMKEDKKKQWEEWQKPPEERELVFMCSLGDVMSGSVLAREVRDRSGRTLLAANQKLTPSMIGKLNDLVEIGEPVQLLCLKRPT